MCESQAVTLLIDVVAYGACLAAALLGACVIVGAVIGLNHAIKEHKIGEKCE